MTGTRDPKSTDPSARDSPPETLRERSAPNPLASNPSAPSPSASLGDRDRGGWPRWGWGVAIALLAIGGGGAAWWLLRSGGPPPAAQSQQMPPKPVETQPLEAGDRARQVELIGQVEAVDRATLRARTDGVVQEILVREGDPVTPGQPVAVLDSADQTIAVSEARARLAEARSDLARLETGTRVEIVAQRRAALEAARAREREAAEDLQNQQELAPARLAQRQAAVESAKAREREAVDNVERVRLLVTTGALADRQLVEAESQADAAREERLEAEAELAAQRTENAQAIANARARRDAARNERLEAEAQLAEAEAGPTAEEIEAQRGIVAAAESALNQAQLGLQRTRVQASVAGTVQARRVSVGDYVESGDELLVVVGGEALDVFLEIPEFASGQVRAGMPVRLQARALPGWTARAEIVGTAPAADARSRRQAVRVRLTAPPPELLPGMAVQAQLELPSPGGEFVISRDALVRRDDRWWVFVVDGETAQQVPVELAADRGTVVAIAGEGLQAGQALVTVGAEGLQDGAPVLATAAESDNAGSGNAGSGNAESGSAGSGSSESDSSESNSSEAGNGERSGS